MIHNFFGKCELTVRDDHSLQKIKPTATVEVTDVFIVYKYLKFNFLLKLFLLWIRF